MAPERCSVDIGPALPFAQAAKVPVADEASPIQRVAAENLVVRSAKLVRAANIEGHQREILREFDFLGVLGGPRSRCCSSSFRGGMER